MITNNDTFPSLLSFVSIFCQLNRLLDSLSFVLIDLTNVNAARNVNAASCAAKRALPIRARN